MKKSRKKSKPQKDQSHPLAQYGLTEEEVVVAVKNAIKNLARKFKFGSFEEDDLEQQAYIWVVTKALPKWDRKRKLGALCYTHIRNKLCNLKRDEYERREPPCQKCPLNAFVNMKCQAFEELEDCGYYYRWLQRNESKKSLAGLAKECPNEVLDCAAPDEQIENQDELARIRRLISEREYYLLISYHSGATLNVAEIEEVEYLMEFLRRIE